MSVVEISATATACIALAGVIASAVRWFVRLKRQDREINNIKQENMLIVCALSACLDGLTQRGAKHSVSKAKKELDDYIIAQAHSQSEVI